MGLFNLFSKKDLNSEDNLGVRDFFKQRMWGAGLILEEDVEKDLLDCLMVSFSENKGTPCAIIREFNGSVEEYLDDLELSSENNEIARSVYQRYYENTDTIIRAEITNRAPQAWIAELVKEISKKQPKIVSPDKEFTSVFIKNQSGKKFTLVSVPKYTPKQVLYGKDLVYQKIGNFIFYGDSNLLNLIVEKELSKKHSNTQSRKK